MTDASATSGKHPPDHGKPGDLKTLLIARARRARRFPTRLRAATAPHGIVLLYHRIAEPSADPWDLSVSPENFAQQLEVLRRFGACKTFTDLADTLAGPAPPKRSVAVTFDDGYLDNMAAGLPALKAAGVPATIFVATGTIGAAREFWWDALVRIFLTGAPLPPTLTLDIGGTRREWAIPDAPAQSYDAWKMPRRPPRDLRLLAFTEVWRALLMADNDDSMRAIDALAAWAGLPPLGDPADHPMNRAELDELAACDLIEIGAHTVWHPPLDMIPPDQAAREITQSRADLEGWLGRPVTSFAYPFGKYDRNVLEHTRAAGLRCACTVYEDIATTKSDPFQIPRIHVKNWPGDMFEAMLREFTGP